MSGLPHCGQRSDEREPAPVPTARGRGGATPYASSLAAPRWVTSVVQAGRQHELDVDVLVAGSGQRVDQVVADGSIAGQPE